MQLTVRDVAQLLRVSEKSVYRWIANGSLPAYRIHDQYRFNRAELLEWATARRINVSVDLFDEPGPSSAIMPGLRDGLKAGGIIYRLAGTDRTSALRTLVDALRLPDEVDRENLFRVMMARELLATTAVGGGIAIPHVRNPVVLHVPRPMITLAFLEQAVSFDALDGKPVNVLFSLVSPTIRAHLHLLSRITFALRDPDFRGVLEAVGSRDEILNAADRVEQNFSRPQDPGGSGGF